MNFMKTQGFMQSMSIRVIMLAVIIGLAGMAEKAGAAAKAFDPEGVIRVEGTATIYGEWACEGQAVVEATPGVALEPVSGFPGGVQTTMVSVSVKDMECGDGTMNRHMRNALKEKNHPLIQFHTDRYNLKGNGDSVKAFGELMIAGESRPVELDAILNALPDDNGVRVVGQVTIQMNEFGVKAPSLLFGTLKVADEVTVKFDTTIQAPDETSSISASYQAR